MYMYIYICTTRVALLEYNWHYHPYIFIYAPLQTTRVTLDSIKVTKLSTILHTYKLQLLIPYAINFEKV